MIIECINCYKKFEVNSNLIPINGRYIQCGSCDHKWFFKKEQFEEKKTIFELKEKKVTPSDIQIPKETETIISEAENKSISKNVRKKSIKNELEKVEKIDKKITNENKNVFSKFFSNILITIISIIALIIILDTLKIPIIKIFPKFEILLFNLYETLKDIKLFIIDLT